MTVINQSDSGESALTDSLGKGLFAAETNQDTRHDHEHGGDAIKRNLAQRQRKED